MQGFLSRDGMPPAELLEVARAEVRAYGVELIEDRVVDVDGGLRLASGRTVTARRLLLATGAVDVLPDVVGARERWGRDFLHCPYCHGWEVRDRPIGVLGTAPGSADHALLLRQWSDDVVYFTHTADTTPDERSALARHDIRVVDGTVSRFVVAGDRLDAVELDDGRRVSRTAVFMRPTLRARLDGLDGLALETDADGFVRTDASGRTRAAGVWAVGNVTNPRAQVITAAGEGSAAAIAINADLLEEDVRTKGAT
jgi:thioredoxin reductase